MNEEVTTFSQARRDSIDAWKEHQAGRRRTIRLKVSDEERDTLMRAAEDHGMTVCQYMRKVLQLGGAE